MEEGQVDYVPVAAPSRKVAGHSRHLLTPGKGKKVSRGPVELPRQFEVLSSSASSRKRAVVDDPTLLLPWHLNVPEEKRGKVGEIKKLRQSFKEE